MRLSLGRLGSALELNSASHNNEVLDPDSQIQNNTYRTPKSLREWNQSSWTLEPRRILFEFSFLFVLTRIVRNASTAFTIYLGSTPTQNTMQPPHPDHVGPPPGAQSAILNL